MIVGIVKFLVVGGRTTATVPMKYPLADYSRHEDQPEGKLECQLLTV